MAGAASPGGCGHPAACNAWRRTCASAAQSFFHSGDPLTSHSAARTASRPGPTLAASSWILFGVVKEAHAAAASEGGGQRRRGRSECRSGRARVIEQVGGRHAASGAQQAGRAPHAGRRLVLAGHQRLLCERTRQQRLAHVAWAQNANLQVRHAAAAQGRAQTRVLRRCWSRCALTGSGALARRAAAPLLVSTAMLRCSSGGGRGCGRLATRPGAAETPVRCARLRDRRRPPGRVPALTLAPSRLL